MNAVPPHPLPRLMWRGHPRRSPQQSKKRSRINCRRRRIRYGHGRIRRPRSERRSAFCTLNITIACVFCIKNTIYCGFYTENHFLTENDDFIGGRRRYARHHHHMHSLVNTFFSHFCASLVPGPYSCIFLILLNRTLTRPCLCYRSRQSPPTGRKEVRCTVTFPAHLPAPRSALRSALSALSSDPHV